MSNLNKHDANEVVAEQDERIRELEGELIEYADRIKDLELAVEGLGNENTDLQRQVDAQERRYVAALALVEAKQHQLAQERDRSAAFQRSLQQVSDAYLQLIKGITELADDIKALEDVPYSSLVSSVEALQAQAYRLVSR